MQIILSPSKTQNFDTSAALVTKSPRFLTKTAVLAKHLKSYSVTDLSKLMKMSNKLAEQTYADFQNWTIEHEANSQAKLKAAIYAYQGAAFSGFELSQYQAADLDYLDKHINIISGFYGLLSALDLIQAYRLELGLRLAFKNKQKQYKNLYEYWQQDINNALAEKGEMIINLASLEYSKIIDKKRFEIINIEFKVKKDNKLRTVGIYAKQQRGSFANWLMKNRIESTDALKKYENAGFRFKGAGSSQNSLLFVKNISTN